MHGVPGGQEAAPKRQIRSVEEKVAVGFIAVQRAVVLIVKVVVVGQASYKQAHASVFGEGIDAQVLAVGSGADGGSQ